MDTGRRCALKAPIPHRASLDAYPRGSRVQTGFVDEVLLYACPPFGCPGPQEWTNNARCNDQGYPRQASQGRSPVGFTVFFVPCQLLCLVSLIATQAIADRAFDTPFESLDEILNRPNLEHTDALELHWRKDIMERKIFTISYNKYWESWNPLWQVAGNRDPRRPYSLRVGAGGLPTTIPPSTYPQRDHADCLRRRSGRGK
ncbi:hypothetical protein N658DRAFT_89913 [Parathielavia hyrcaniae]|uniref:Uncharacterized protein n=1 Tax=Parathielavia hyrcaniae TaxID=113614 RepID=A0AAN6PUW5_9PEZI|nr:hypothetical protein N658DRAFT_89913 [Parathielavia hyrcaniae]